MKPQSLEALRAALGELDWADIDTLRERVDAAGDFWGEEFLADTERQAKNAWLRKAMRSLSEDGHRAFASVEQTDEDGDIRRVYKQERLFAPDDYAACVKYHGERAHHHINEALGYRNRAQARYGITLPLPLEGF